MKNVEKKGAFSRRVAHSTQTEQLTKRTKALGPARPAARKRPKSRPKYRTELEEWMYLEQEEKDAFFSVITSKRDVCLFRIAYHRGLRAHEVGLLKMSDFRGDRLHVHRGKGSRSGIYTLTRVELHALKMWLRERGPAPGPIFLSRQQGGAVKRRRLDQLMKKYCALAGIDYSKAHMHALRHSCGTHLAERGHQADAIQDALGHVDIKNTNRYLHFSRRRRDEMAEQLRDWR
jgi:integrase